MKKTVALETKLMRKAVRRLNSAATSPASSGPRMVPRRMDVVRIATARPRFEAVLTSAMRIDELVCHMDVPMAPTNSRMKNWGYVLVKKLPNDVRPRRLLPMSSRGFRPHRSVTNPVTGPETSRDRDMAEASSVTRKTEPSRE